MAHQQFFSRSCLHLDCWFTWAVFLADVFVSWHHCLLWLKVRDNVSFIPPYGVPAIKMEFVQARLCSRWWECCQMQFVGRCILNHWSFFKPWGANALFVYPSPLQALQVLTGPYMCDPFCLAVVQGHTQSMSPCLLMFLLWVLCMWMGVTPREEDNEGSDLPWRSSKTR